MNMAISPDLMNLQEVNLMSWNEELYNIYELNCSREFDDNEPEMLPVSHSTANAQIEVTIDVKEKP